jgi:hypothetical protein
MNLMKLIQRQSWHSRKLFKATKVTDDSRAYFYRILRLASTRASMASWGLPIEAITSWLLLALGEDQRGKHDE